MQGVTRQTGIISDIDEAVVRVRVTLPECDNLRSNWLPVLQRNTQNNKDYWLPDIGEQVEVLLDDNGEDGVVLGAVYSSVDTAPLASRDKRYVQFSDGAAFEYDRALHQLTVNGGIEKIVIEVKESTRLTSPQVEVKAQQVTVTSETVNVVSNNVAVKAMNITVDAPISHFTGNINVLGNISASGVIMDGGGNSNHHSH
ncbi:phage baseplate assembly protein V [Salmonella enterica]|uniref:Phage baseplate assembly protein V n=1 Tax=Salmonella enterica TaxID=28901 RepID=A0A702EGQ1_SALER|nr:phage baseplate assembly protein V [Salmonella enterica]EBS7636634.1 phage baseplate assembly protein V [Salmonella enterica]HAC6576389.1 phage baseplate assembly protein V [Salmonella enterica subsp. indica]HBC0061841.1 phage baseplate assembly protein V [Salmonella enterica]HCL5300532.1 phage baseplate assembly protein V [Salmonella enterica]